MIKHKNIKNKYINRYIGIATLLVFSLLISGCFTENKNDEEIEEEYEVVLESPSYIYEDYSIYLEDYDEVKLSKAFLYNSVGEIEQKFVYEYDNLERNTKTDVYDKDDNLIEYYIYEYDLVHERNIKSGKYYDNEDNIVAQYETIFNDVGEYTEILDKDNEGNIIGRQTCTYDDSGDNFLIESYFDGEENLLRSYEATYDEDGFEVSEHYISMRGDEEVEFDYNFYYNDFGDMYLQTYLDDDSDLSEIRLYDYDNFFDENDEFDFSEMVEESFLIGSNIQTKSNYFYNFDGEYTEIINYNFNYDNSVNSRYVFTYSYEDEYDIYKYELYLPDMMLPNNVINKKSTNKNKHNKFKILKGKSRIKL